MWPEPAWCRARGRSRSEAPPSSCTAYRHQLVAFDTVGLTVEVRWIASEARRDLGAGFGQYLVGQDVGEIVLVAQDLAAYGRDIDAPGGIVALLLGLVANAAAGWWWADPVAALLMVPWLLMEGVEGIRGESCEEDDDGCASS